MAPDALVGCFLEPKVLARCCLAPKAFRLGVFLAPKTLLGVRPGRVLLRHLKLCWVLGLAECH